ncbi:BTAD domain-containing putative transcriptional regulator [Streptomyces catenulae]|uniref:BTAD domain-containing putative transcriptional regulator n=1 Tax=Streptomyces catenulae TaxID=66875 RepID=A0ABV2YYW9_9ACTN|nr:BTAD domain-containing putative transcriptional regulator [Streptomyces catenulae]
MPTPATDREHPHLTPLTGREREVLHALGHGLDDAGIAATLGLPAPLVTAQLEGILRKLGLRDRTAALAHTADRALVVPGLGPHRTAPDLALPPGPRLRISLLGPLRVRLAGRPVDVGPVRQQAVLAALALRSGRSVSRRELLDGVWGLESPDADVVPVYVYRLRKPLRFGTCPDSVIRRDRYGYGLAHGVAEVDVARMEDEATAAATAARAGDLRTAVRHSSRSLELFRGEPLAGLPGPLAETERMRLAERRVALARRRAEWLLRLGRVADAVAALTTLASEEPLHEPVAALLMRALHHGGRRAEALAVFDRTARHLTGDLGVPPGELLLRARWSVLRDDATARDTDRAGAA